MLQKRAIKLEIVKNKIHLACWAAVQAREKDHIQQKIAIEFKPGSLILVRNSTVDKDLGSKTKPRYTRPMVVIQRTKGGSYILADLDGSLSKLRYGTFCLFPYYPCDIHAVPIMKLVGISTEDLDALADCEHDNNNEE
jgi:hypothetical protein